MFEDVCSWPQPSMLWFCRVPKLMKSHPPTPLYANLAVVCGVKKKEAGYTLKEMSNAWMSHANQSFAYCMYATVISDDSKIGVGIGYAQSHVQVHQRTAVLCCVDGYGSKTASPHSVPMLFPHLAFIIGVVPDHVIPQPSGLGLLLKTLVVVTRVFATLYSVRLTHPFYALFPGSSKPRSPLVTGSQPNKKEFLVPEICILSLHIPVLEVPCEARFFPRAGSFQAVDWRECLSKMYVVGMVGHAFD